MDKEIIVVQNINPDALRDLLKSYFDAGYKMAESIYTSDLYTKYVLNNSKK